MLSSKKLTCIGTLRQVFICLRPPPPSYDPLPPPLYTLYTCLLFTYSHREGEGGEFNQRKDYIEGQHFTKIST
jgi:hypothetical protein